MKRKLLSLLLSATMLLTLVTPALADEEGPPNADSEYSGDAVVEDGAENEVVLFGDENPPASPVGGGGIYYDIDDNGVATVENREDFLDAMYNDDVQKVVVQDSITLDNGQEINISKPLTIAGTLVTTGRMENYSEIIVEDGGTLEIPDSDTEITYDYDDERGWETAENHVLFNRGYLEVQQGGTLTVGGALQNDNDIKIFGEMKVCASASGDVLEDGVLNGAVRTSGYFEVNGGTLTVEAAQEGDKNCAVFVNIGEFKVFEKVSQLNLDGLFYQYGHLELNDGGVSLGGVFYQYGYLELNDGCVSLSGELYNKDGDIDLNNSRLDVNGYLRNNSRLHLNGGTLEVMPAAELNYEKEGETFNDKLGVLCNNNELNIENGAALIVNAQNTNAPNNAILRNNGEIRNNGGTLTLDGTLYNFFRVENYGTFTVAETGYIENHYQLRVGNSASYEGWGYAPINWPSGAKPSDGNLFDDTQLRLAQIHWDDEGIPWNELRADVYSIKGDEWRDMVVVCGQDYFGGWEDESNATITIENLKYNENGDRDETGELDPVTHISVTQQEDGVYTLSFDEWGETRIALNSDNGEATGRYDGGVCLNHAGFYFDCDIINKDGCLNEERAQDAAVLGNTYCYNTNDILYLMKRDCGLDGSEQNIINEAEVWINGERVEGERGNDGWFRFGNGEQCLIELKFAERNQGGYDIIVQFPETAEETFDFQFRYHDADCYLRCCKPTVYVEDTIRAPGSNTVTVAVKAENFNELQGYWLQLSFDSSKLTVSNVAVNGEYSYACGAETLGKVSVSAANAETIENGDLFYVTFTVADTVENGSDVLIEFDKDFDQEMSFRDEKIVNAAYRDGNIQTILAGDVKHDGKVDILDPVRLLRAAAELVTLSPVEREAARVTQDSDYLINGVVPILQYLAKNTPLTYYPASSSAED